MGRGQGHVASREGAETSLTFGPMLGRRTALTRPPSHPTPMRAQHHSPALTQPFPSILLYAGGIMAPLTESLARLANVWVNRRLHQIPKHVF